MSFENSIRRKSIATRDTAFRSMQHENSLMANGSRSEFNKTHRSRERLPNYSIKAKGSGFAALRASIRWGLRPQTPCMFSPRRGSMSIQVFRDGKANDLAALPGHV